MSGDEATQDGSPKIEKQSTSSFKSDASEHHQDENWRGETETRENRDLQIFVETWRDDEIFKNPKYSQSQFGESDLSDILASRQKNRAKKKKLQGAGKKTVLASQGPSQGNK